MAAGKTFVEGSKTVLDGAFIEQASGNTSPGHGGGMYSQSGNVSNRTYVPGQPGSVDDHGREAAYHSHMSEQYHAGYNDPEERDEERLEERTLRLLPRPVVGVLYSVSRGLNGEVFPVYLGHNRLGRAESSDVVLREVTVSQNHADLHVMRDEDTGVLEAVLSDRGSYYGSDVNGADARYETVKLNDGDIVRIGHHYKFLFRLFNSEYETLVEEEGFEATPPVQEDTEPEEIYGESLSTDFYAPSDKKKSSDKTVLND